MFSVCMSAGLHVCVRSLLLRARTCEWVLAYAHSCARACEGVGAKACAACRCKSPCMCAFVCVCARARVHYLSRPCECVPWSMIVPGSRICVLFAVKTPATRKLASATTVMDAADSGSGALRPATKHGGVTRPALRDNNLIGGCVFK